MPGNGLPQLQGKDGVMKGGATRAAVRYLGLKYGYYPDDPMRAQECDMITDAYYDTFGPQGETVLGKGNDANTIPDCQKKYKDEVLPKFLTFLEPYCARGTWLCGNKICTADFWVGAVIVELLCNDQSWMKDGSYQK